MEEEVMIAFTVLMGMLAVLIITIGVSLFFSGQFVGFPIIVVGMILLIIIGVLTIRR
jgi:hypothetical protein